MLKINAMPELFSHTWWCRFVCQNHKIIEVLLLYAMGSRLLHNHHFSETLKRLQLAPGTGNKNARWCIMQYAVV